MNLAAYHLPLDAHPTLGNNALLADAVGLREPRSVRHLQGARDRGARGAGRRRIPAAELVERVRAACGREPLHFAGGPPTVRTLGIVSGGAARQVGEAVALGLDAYLTGEPTESVMTEALEGGVHFLAAGHYATETFGVRALGEHLAQRFGLEHAFVDLPNPV